MVEKMKSDIACPCPFVAFACIQKKLLGRPMVATKTCEWVDVRECMPIRDAYRSSVDCGDSKPSRRLTHPTVARARFRRRPQPALVAPRLVLPSLTCRQSTARGACEWDRADRQGKTMVDGKTEKRADLTAGVEEALFRDELRRQKRTVDASLQDRKERRPGGRKSSARRRAGGRES